MFLKAGKTAQGAKTHHGNKASGNETQKIYVSLPFLLWYNTLRNLAVARLSRFALKDCFVTISGEIKYLLRSCLISC